MASSLRKLCAMAVLAGAGLVAPVAMAQGKIVTIQVVAEPANYDPHKILHSTVAEVIANTQDTLVAVQDDLKTVTHSLADRWQMSADGLTYSFHLKDNLKFCDGKPITSKEVVASFKRWMDPATKASNLVLMGPLQEVDAPDAVTVRFRLREPYAEFLQQLATPYAGVIDAAEAQELGAKFAVTGMNGSGPYCWGGWRPREGITLTRNPYHTWGNGVFKNQGVVMIDRIDYKTMPEGNARSAAMLAGQSDISYRIPWGSLGEFRANKKFTVAEVPQLGWVAFLGTKIQRPLMEPAVRKAMNYAVDREAIVDAIYKGQAYPAYFPVSPRFSGYNTEVDAIAPKYNKALAITTLEDAGWKLGSDGVRVKNGVRLAPVVAAYSSFREYLEAVQGMMREVGIDLKLEITDPAIAQTRFFTKDDFDMWAFFGSYTSVGELLQKYFLPSQILSPYKLAPEQGKAIEALIVAGRKEMREPERTAIYDRAQKLVAEGNFWVPLVHERLFVTSNNTRVTGVKPHGLGGNGLYKAIDLDTVR